MHHKNWETSIHCDGTPVEEYGLRIENEDTVSCCIASEVGKNFSVHWKNELHVTASADCYMDGRLMTGSRVKPGKSGVRWGVRTGDAVRQAFQFSALVVTDDDNVASAEDPDVDAIGVIEVRVYRVRQSFRPRKHEYKARPVPARAPVHEKSKKAGTHCVSLGEQVSCAPHVSSQSPKVIYLDKRHKPYIRFIFRYRPRALLQADGIIPLDPPSVHDAEDDAAPRQTSVLVEAEEVNAAGQRRTSVKQEPKVRAGIVDSEEHVVEVGALLRSHSVKSDRYSLAAVNTESAVQIIDVDNDVIDLTLDD